MPDVKVPLKDERGWDALLKRRKEWWAQQERDRLTAHFAASEFHCRDGTHCPTVSRPGLIKLCRTFLEPLRKEFGPCIVLSGYRHEVYNRAIGGARHSQHIYEQGFESVASDVRFARGHPRAWAMAAKKLRVKAGNEGGIGLYTRQGFVHLDTRNYTADWSG